MLRRWCWRTAPARVRTTRGWCAWPGGWRCAAIRILTFNFPYKAAGRSAPDPGTVLEEAFQSAWRGATRGATGRLFAGGKSMGGRIASQAAARGLFDPAPRDSCSSAIRFIRLANRISAAIGTCPAIQLPMLFLHGTRDPFGSPEEMQALAKALPTATLDLMEGGDHSLVSTKRADPQASRSSGRSTLRGSS